MKTQYYTATSLDGFIATEDDSLEWLFPLGDVNDSSYPEFIAEVGALAMGSATYEWMLRHADQVAAETGSPWPYTQPVWVFTSRDLSPVEGADVRFASGDVSRVHAQMRAVADGKNLWIVGGGDLAGQFHDAGLLDEIIVQVGSATLGKGKPLFPRRVLSPALRLVSVRQMGAGMAELRYEVGEKSQQDDSIVIRRYQPGEENAIWDVYFRATHESNSRDYHPDLLNRWAPADQDMAEWNDRCVQKNPFVAVTEDRIVGMAELEQDGFVDYFYVNPDFQGRGIGSRMLARLESEARKMDLTRLTADVSLTAKEFFESRGFIVTEAKMNVIIGHPAPNFAMEKEL